ncbi:alpha/beta fold hydrolase [Nocardioides sp.]|uniref:alpha/beta fold hydrolase n=1 Tax=Nocardioides sp. TaxID=35761 RepID=UPI002ED1EB1E
MHVDANGTRLWFDVHGPQLVPDGPELRRRPTLLLVHGGPGSFDHSYFKPDFDVLADDAQVVYLDLPGHGRSSWEGTDAWTLETCADDVRAFCDALGIASPVVLGHSMGGPIVLLYGARHPGHAGGLIVQSGFARWDAARLVEGFRAVGGDVVAELARRSYAGEDVSDPEWDQVYAAFGPHLPDPGLRANVPVNRDLSERGMDLIRAVDLVDQLSRVTSPVLVSVGELDPVTPVGAAEEVVAALPAGSVRLDVVPGAGHFTWLDAPDRVFASYRRLLGEVSAASTPEHA